jgi:hypothetical protein
MAASFTFTLAFTLSGREDAEAALEALQLTRAALERDPSVPYPTPDRVDYVTARAWVQQGQISQAESLLTSVLEAQRARPEPRQGHVADTLWLTALCKWRAGDRVAGGEFLEQARTAYAVAEGEQGPHTLLMRALQLASEGDTNESHDAMTLAQEAGVEPSMVDLSLRSLPGSR